MKPRRGTIPGVRGSRAGMASRHEPPDSLDHFATPPWATRALVEVVLPRLGVREIGLVCDPCCGDGHMAEVLCEYADKVIASDVFSYGYARTVDFFEVKPISFQRGGIVPDWFIFNGPFGDRAAKFVRHALELGRAIGARGVCSFHQLRWQETIERFDLFTDFPPNAFAPFAERVNVVRGRWNPDGTTATANQWIVWQLDRPPVTHPATIIIPPGQRVALERPDDRVRFTRKPVIKAHAGRLA